MAVNKKDLLLTEQDAVDLILRHRNYKHDLDLASILAGAREQLSKIREGVEGFRLKEGELPTALIKYYLDICQTNPPQMPNQTDALKQCLEAQLQAILEVLSNGSISTHKEE